MSCQLHVGNLNHKVSDKTIEDEFRLYRSVRITRKSPKYALVDFDNPNDALQAIRNLDGLHGWKVNPSLRQHGAGSKQLIREYKTQSKVLIDQVPVSQQCNVESKTIEPAEKSSNIDELASKLKSMLEDKVRELGAVNEENEKLNHKLNEANAEITSAKAMEEEMTLKLKKLGEQLEETNKLLIFSKVKGEDMILMLKKLKAELAKSKSSAKAKESEMSLKLKKVEDELEKVKSNASSAKNKEEAMDMKLNKFEEKLRKSEKYGVELNEKLKEIEGVKETLEAEIKNINEKTQEWRKTAETAATIFSVGVEINAEISESESIFSCYMNRAAMHLSLERVRESLLYLRMAAILDPNSLEPRLMSAERHLTLGEVEDALYYYTKCSKSASTSCFDTRVAIEAANGIQKAQKLDSCIKHSSQLLQRRTFSSATKALEVISEAMSISPSSEKLLEMQGEALFVLQKYEEVVQLCERTLYFAEKNFSIVGVSNFEYGKKLSKLWRWNLMSKSYFHWGRLDMALDFIEKQENLRAIKDNIEESTILLAATVRELLHCKKSGNEAFQSGRYTEAVKHYTNAMSRSTESRPFSAVCLFNRAAAYQALNKITDAIADCNLALALDGSYQKAIFKRAKLHEKIRHYEKSASDFKRFISVIENQTPDRQAIIKEARLRLFYIQEKTKRETTMDFYLILGVNDSDSTSEIKKAYRRAALNHHPDKAGLFLARSKSEHDGQLWKDISKTISMDAEELFKIIGEAYSVLSDSRKRYMYDMGEMMRYEDEGSD